MKIFFYLFVFFISFLNYLHAQSCKGTPLFMSKKGFDPTRSALSSQEKKIRGVALIEFEDARNPNGNRTKLYQNPSWLMTGYAGSITTSRYGDLYVLPKANVNMLYNQPKDQNTIYKIDSESGIMSSWLSLPMKKSPGESNANGLLSAYYDCDVDALMVSSIAGSTQKEEMGTIFCVDIRTKDFFVLLNNIDVLAILTAKVGVEKKLFYGLARKSEIWSVNLDAHNKIVGAPQLEINLEGIGPRGDDKARKMRMDQNNLLIVYGVPFFYNLTAPVTRQETIYVYQFNSVSKKWILKSMN